MIINIFHPNFFFSYTHCFEKEYFENFKMSIIIFDMIMILVRQQNIFNFSDTRIKIFSMMLSQVLKLAFTLPWNVT